MRNLYKGGDWLIERVKKKIVQSGDIIEIYDYSDGYLKGFTNNKADSGRKSDYKSENYEEHRKQVLQRAKKNLRRLINANVGQYGKEFTAKFLTLTFKDNVKDLDKANYEFTKFIKRLNYYCFGTKKANLKYTCVIEFQKRGAIHYHIIIYNMPYVHWDKLLDLWDRDYKGGIWINKINDVDNVGAYVSEYLGNAEKGQGKDILDDRLQGRKIYFSSRVLFKPIEITDEKTVEQVAAALPSHTLKYSAEFSNEYLGDITYKQYNLNLKWCKYFIWHLVREGKGDCLTPRISYTLEAPRQGGDFKNTLFVFKILPWCGEGVYDRLSA